MTKAEQAFLGVALVALVAIFVMHYQRPGTGSVLAESPNATGYGNVDNGPAYLIASAPWAAQPWNGGAVMPQASAGIAGQNSDVVDMAGGGSTCGGCG